MLNAHKITYTTKFSPKRKTLGLSVERDKSVIVYAPEGTGEGVIADFVERKRFWLYEKLHHTKKFTPIKQRTPFKTGKAILYLGRNYSLEVVGQDIDRIEYRKGKFYINEQKTSMGQDFLDKWYQQKAHEKILSRAKQLAHQMGLEPREIKVRDLKYSWGTCSPKRSISLNWKLIKAPYYVIDYVIIHELAHLLELNHTPDFWNIVKIQMPRYEDGKQWLKENGDLIFEQ